MYIVWTALVLAQAGQPAHVVTWTAAGIERLASEQLARQGVPIADNGVRLHCTRVPGGGFLVSLRVPGMEDRTAMIAEMPADEAEAVANVVVVANALWRSLGERRTPTGTAPAEPAPAAPPEESVPAPRATEPVRGEAPATASGAVPVSALYKVMAVAPKPELATTEHRSRDGHLTTVVRIGDRAYFHWGFANKHAEVTDTPVAEEMRAAYTPGGMLRWILLAASYLFAAGTFGIGLYATISVAMSAAFAGEHVNSTVWEWLGISIAVTAGGIGWGIGTAFIHRATNVDLSEPYFSDEELEVKVREYNEATLRRWRASASPPGRPSFALGVSPGGIAIAVRF